MSYYIKPEFHVAPAVVFDGKRYPAVEYQYAIRRVHDHSLVYRTQQHELAAEILSNLTHPKTVAA